MGLRLSIPMCPVQCSMSKRHPMNGMSDSFSLILLSQGPLCPSSSELTSISPWPSSSSEPLSALHHRQGVYDISLLCQGPSSGSPLLLASLCNRQSHSRLLGHSYSPSSSHSACHRGRGGAGRAASSALPTSIQLSLLWVSWATVSGETGVPGTGKQAEEVSAG